jgi:hypothetical protein
MSGIAQAGEISVNKIKFINLTTGFSINLTELFVDLTLYEDLYSPVLNGYIVVSESRNLVSNLPIVGGEVLQVKFNTPNLSEVDRLFVITGIGPREYGDKSQNYVLNFISLSSYKDLNTRMSRSFYGVASEQAAALYSKVFSKGLKSVDESTNKVKLISPYWGPYKIINYLASRAVRPSSGITTPNFLFYETLSGHHFRSLSSLFSAKVKAEFFLDKTTGRFNLPDGSSVRNVAREYATILEMKFVESQDYLKSLINGAYSHAVSSFDLFSKKFDIKTYSIGEQFYATAHLDKFKLKANDFTAPNAGLMSTIIHTSGNNMTDIDHDDIDAKRVSLLAQLEQFKVDIRIHGRSDLEVGQVIYVNMSEMASIDDKHHVSLYDKTYSGKFLITALSHRIAKNKHEIHMQCIKDSIMKEVK